MQTRLLGKTGNKDISILLLIYPFDKKIVNDQEGFVTDTSGFVTYLRTLFLRNFVILILLTSYSKIIFSIKFVLVRWKKGARSATESRCQLCRDT